MSAQRAILLAPGGGAPIDPEDFYIESVEDVGQAVGEPALPLAANELVGDWGYPRPRLPEAEPKSIKQLLRESGIALGGAVRARYSKAIDDILWLTWLEAIADTGSPEEATVMVFGIVARDPSYAPPHWLVLTFKRHRAAIVQAVQSGHFAR